MIEIKNLTKKYGQKYAVNDVSFDVNDGEILGFLGPNGAGKTTTMNIITGYLGATEGTVTVNGLDTVENAARVKRMIGYLPEQPPLYLDMTVDEYLSFVYNVKKVTSNKKFHIDGILDAAKIGDVRGRKIKNLSKGYRQRVGLAQALIGHPDILILDEPTVGLDPQQILDMRNFIRDLGGEHTIILSSHILPEISAIADRVVIINRGKIVAEDTPEHLSENLSGRNTVIAKVEGEKDSVMAAINSVAGVTNVECDGESYRITSDSDIKRDLSIALSQSGFILLGLTSDEMSLEDIFLTLTGEDEKEGEE